MNRSLAIVGIVTAALLGGCKNDTSSTGGTTPQGGREIGQFNEGTGTTQPANATATRPAGTMPNDAIHANIGAGADIVPQFEAHADWQPKPPRSMTDQVFALPRAEGDPEDGDLAISHLGQHIPLQGNITRWCGFFGYRGEDCEKNAKRQELQGTKFPTTLVDISGTYTGSSMMGPAAPPKENYRMLVAEVRTPQRPFYVRLTGPQKTVAKWEETFLKLVKEAE